MTFLNAKGSRSNITIPSVKETSTEIEAAAAMDVIIALNIFTSAGGDLVDKHSAQITDRNVTPLEVK